MKNRAKDWIIPFLLTNVLFAPLLTFSKCDSVGFLSLVLITFIACVIGKVFFWAINLIDKSLGK